MKLTLVCATCGHELESSAFTGVEEGDRVFVPVCAACILDARSEMLEAVRPEPESYRRIARSLETLASASDARMVRAGRAPVWLTPLLGAAIAVLLLWAFGLYD